MSLILIPPRLLTFLVRYSSICFSNIVHNSSIFHPLL
nr:MAG TPA: hypothetical protein [Caudoviricetes sp.]